jgi:hypothetical protein
MPGFAIKVILFIQVAKRNEIVRRRQQRGFRIII